MGLFRILRKSSALRPLCGHFSAATKSNSAVQHPDIDPQMRFVSLAIGTSLAAVVGLGGCVDGSIEGNPYRDSEASKTGSPSGGTDSGAGGSSSVYNPPGSSGGSQGVPAGGSSNPSQGGQSTSGGTGNANAGTSNATGGTGNTTGGNPSGGTGNATGGSPSGGTGNSAGSSGSGGTPPVVHDCKRGIGWHGSKLDHPKINTELTWWYTWGLSVQTLGAGLEFVPMVWGGGATVDGVNKALRPEAKFLLGFNEPNFFEQANLSAAQAAAQWPVLQQVATQKGLKLVSPAVNYCGDDKNKTGPCHDTNPVSYLSSFFAACTNCQVDYVAVHWYNCDGASLKSYLDLFKQFNRPLWVTELACAYGGDTSVAGQEKYMREAIPILEGRADVYRYSWFSGDPLPNARLLNADGTPTPLGDIYLSLPRDPTCTP
jgi:hypothetical protein